MPALRKHIARFRAAEFGTMFEADGLPFAPITQPEDLFNDPHLLAEGGPSNIVLPDSRITRAPLRPLTLNKQRPGLRLNSPQLGEHTAELLAGLGCGEAEIQVCTQQPGPNRSAKWTVRCGIKRLEAFHAFSPMISGTAAIKYIAVQAAVQRFSCD